MSSPSGAQDKYKINTLGEVAYDVWAERILLDTALLDDPLTVGPVDGVHAKLPASSSSQSTHSVD